MPLHLDPLSRRRFLGGSAALVLAPLLPCAGQAAESESWALVSDPHIAADRSKISPQGTHMAGNLEKVVAEILRETDGLAGVIIDGDGAYNDGQAGDYATLLTLLAPLREAGLPIHFTMGNHDNRETFAAALGDAAVPSPVGGKYCSLIETPLVNWLLLDSLLHVNHVEGEIGAEQLAWIERLLAEHPGKPAILVGHHNPQPIKKNAEGDPVRITGLVDTDAFLEKIGSHSSAKAYVYGHTHNWGYKREENGLHLVNLPTTAYVFDSSIANGWVHATVTAGGLSLKLHTLDPAHPKQGETRQFAWR